MKQWELNGGWQVRQGLRRIGASLLVDTTLVTRAVICLHPILSTRYL